ncbi:hypothetical protein [Chitinophaga rhizosphaerae]|uniref:hypothetical protein n=1 Tax=Chitinophaga rhizosphaerae TaxID=1864947 RepID=UPI000F807388|nr:hypothetical protein [Chitinophaga rhizosphaerae]
MKKYFIAFGALAVAGIAFAGGRASIYATATDLYVKKSASVCTRLVNAANVISSQLITSGTGQQAQIVSNGGTAFDLFEDNACTHAVYFPN